MKSLEYVIVIDFGIANTKCICWDVKNNKNIPVRFDKQQREGILYTTTEYQGRFYTNFFDKPSCMTQVGDMPVFTNFAKDLFRKIIANNPFLCCSDVKNPGENFIVVVSYPSMWDEEDGSALLQILQKLLPSVRYAIREDVALRELLFHKEEQGLVVDIGAGKVVTYDNHSSRIYFGFSLSQIESRMTEKALLVCNDQDNSISTDINPDLLRCIQNDDISRAEHILKCVKERLNETGGSKESPKSIEEKWFYDSLYELNPFVEATFRKIKTRVGNCKTFYVTGGMSDYIGETISTVFSSQSEIEVIGLFGICYGIINFFKRVYQQSCELMQQMHSKMLSDSDYSTFNSSCSELANGIISRICLKEGEKKLQNYVNRSDRTSFNDLTKDVKRFITDKLPKFLDSTIAQEMGIGISCKVDNLCNSIIEDIEIPDRNEVLIQNSFSNYITLSINPVLYSHENLSSELYDKVYRIHYVSVTLDKPREYSQRNDVFELLMNYFKNNKLVNRSPKISWSLIEETELFLMYCLDTICMNCNSILSLCTPFKNCHVDLSNIRNTINYSINMIIQEGTKKNYELVDGVLTYKKSSKIRDWDSFDFDTYIKISKSLKSNYIELQKDIINLSTITIYDLYKNYPNIYQKLKNFFCLEISDIDLFCGIILPFNSNNIYDLIINQYMAFRETK